MSTSVLSTLDVKIGPYVTLRNRAANPGIGIYCKNASVEVDSSMIGFGGRSDVGIKVDSGAELFMTYSTIQDWDSWAVQVLASADSANISGYNSFRSPGTLTATGYCFTQADSCTMQFPQTYVQNGRTAELPAENNYWYGQEFCYVCAAEAFVGDIDYEPYETSDQTIGGTFPQFLLAGGDSEPEPADLPAARPRVTAFPNPFNPSVTLAAEGLEGQLEFSIFDVSGRLVRRMSPLAGGTRVQWDGRDDHGRLASSGVYFVRVAAAEQVQPIKIVLLR